MSTADRIKLDSLTRGGDGGGEGATTIDQITGLRAELDDTAHVHHAHQLAATDAAGFMSAADKAKLDSLGTSTGASTIAQVEGLQARLTLLAGTDADLDATLSLKANSEHTHDLYAVTDLVDLLNSKAPNCLADNETDGLMSIADKVKLDSLSPSSEHTHPGLPNLSAPTT